MKNCEYCGEELFAKQDRYCSKECVDFGRSLCKRGIFKVENENGKTIHTLKFYDKNELKALMQSFAGAPVVVVRFVNQTSAREVIGRYERNNERRKYRV